MASGSLDEHAELDRRHLYLFVAGPGLGEGIAVALPGGGWILVDGCATGKSFPLEEILVRWRRQSDDPIVAMILTHPHDDHVEGFAELVDSLAPRCIGLAGKGGSDLLALCKELLGQRHAKEKLLAAKVLSALKAIHRREEGNPGTLLALHDGMRLQVEPSPARVTVRAPDPEGLRDFMNTDVLAKRLKAKANHISLVLEIEYGRARVVLGGDLPRYEKSREGVRVVSTGWDAVMKRHPGLGTHAALKLPHHGSSLAIHPALMPIRGVQERAWVMTPHSRAKLPRVASGDGVPALLESEPSVMVSSLPVGKDRQATAPHPGLVTLSQFMERVSRQPTEEHFFDGAGIDVTPGPPPAPLDPIWCIAVDDGGELKGRWRGQVAVEVIP